MNVFENNPYRQLGIYSNSPVKERVANSNRLKAFLKVGKQVDFPLDLTQYLLPIIRTSESVAQAEACLALPNEQLKYAQFWFVKATPLDDIAFNHLFAGNMEGAVEIWSKRDNASSLQNRLVCVLTKKDYRNALTYAELLYTQYAQQFVSAIIGNVNNILSDALAHDFIDALCEEVPINTLCSVVKKTDWKDYIKAKAINPLIEKIESAIEITKSSKGKGSTVRYNAGYKLMNDTKASLQELKKLLSPTDLQYQVVADKLGLEILQCGIDYFNASDERDAARKAMLLQSYAMEIVVGKMAKDRCKENVDILQKIIADLPPLEVFVEDKAIKEELHKFSQRPEKISHAVTLLNSTKPYLQVIKARLGVNNAYYLKISTLVVGNALHNIIEEVNAAQQDETIEIGGRRIPISLAVDRYGKIQQIKDALQAAWRATRIMDTFDMEADFKVNRYNQNRAILRDLCQQMEIYTGNRWVTPPPPPPIEKKASSSTNWGCIIGIIVAIVFFGLILIHS